jgi:hypothetical protein
MHKDDGEPAFPDQDYIAFDPCEGDRDVDVRLRTVKLVVARKEHSCFFGTGPYGDAHTIKSGDRYRYERALIDRDYWGQYRVCLPCMDKWLRERDGGNDASK